MRWHDIQADTRARTPRSSRSRSRGIDVVRAVAAPGGAEDPFADTATTPPRRPSEDVWGEASDAAAASSSSEFSDAVAIQLPVAPPDGPTKPYFIFGDGSRAVDLWFLDTGQKRVHQYVGRGTGNLTLAEGTEVDGSATYANGEWSAVFVRDLRSTNSISFAEGGYVPVSFAVWDGLDRERGSRRALTQWFYVYLAPREKTIRLWVPCPGGSASRSSRCSPLFLHPPPPHCPAA